MSKTKYGHSTLSGLIDSDSDEGPLVARHGILTLDSGAENRVVGKKGRGRPKSAMPTKVTKSKAPARRTSGRLAKLKDVAPAKEPRKKAAATKPTAAKGKRKVLADKTNQQYPSDTEEVEDFDQNEDTIMGDELDETVLAVKEPRAKPAKKAAVGRGKAAKMVPMEIVEPEEPAVEPLPKKKRGPIKRQVASEPEPSLEKIIQETQVPQAMDIDDSNEIVEEVVSKVAHNVRRPRSSSRTRHHSAQRRRAGSASDTERSDPALRRKLGDLTKKYENLNVKYQDLREIGLKEGERNFERLRKQTEESKSAYDKLITSLKADVASQASLAKESRGQKKKLESQTADMLALEEKLADMTASLAEAHAQNKTLAAKLAANRTVAASVESANTKVPGSAVKANGGIRMMGTAEAAQVAQAAQLKEDLYSDLTGLIIRSVKRESEDDVYDCIQTGRNGTLHFKLAVANDKSAESYEDAQCQYVPQLDPSRDKALMELLPDYLVEEITFPRPQAARFYARVGKALTERVD